MKRKSLRLHAVALLISVCFALTHCGKSLEDAAKTHEDDGSIPVNGSAFIYSQCPYGSLSSKVPVGIKLVDCPIPLKTAELTEPLQPLIVTADCTKKILTVRTEDRAVDTSWEIMPDGSFWFTVNGGMAKFKTDGTTPDACKTPLTLDIWGTLDCTDRDKLVIHTQAAWTLGKETQSPGHAPMVPNTDHLRLCKMPQGCNFYGTSDIKQCQ